jgi:hypothetical protein
MLGTTIKEVFQVLLAIRHGIGARWVVVEGHAADILNEFKAARVILKKFSAFCFLSLLKTLNAGETPGFLWLSEF